MTLQTAGTSGPAYRQRPGDPHIVECQPKAGARWKIVETCSSPLAAQQWIFERTRRYIAEQENQTHD